MLSNRDHSSHALSSFGLASSFVWRAILRLPPPWCPWVFLALPPLLGVGAARCCHALSEGPDALYHAISSSPSEMGLQAIDMLYATPAWHVRNQILSVGYAHTVGYSRTIGKGCVHTIVSIVMQKRKYSYKSCMLIQYWTCV